MGSDGQATSVPTRVPVYAIWQERIGPVLSVGMLTAAARHHDGGALNEHYDIRPPVTASQFLTEVAGHHGPVVLLCSDYVWSLDDNLAAARQARALGARLFVVHGGPSVPKDEAAAAEFLDELGDLGQVLVHGEGEDALCEILTVLASSVADEADLSALDGVAGITYRHPGTGIAHRTGERTRRTELDDLPSPYLSGEFDHIDPAAWFYSANIETNRGCPYGCTFCDWGSATMSRIRMFGVDRVVAEVEWAARRGIRSIQLCDANFGITKRDAEIARRIADVHTRVGLPAALAMTPAKNTTKHITTILDVLLDVGMRVSLGISLQTTDATVLDAVARSNISTDAYLALAAELRRRGIAPAGDVLVGLPEQTYETFKNDLQFFLDHEVMARTWLVQLLPNAPMNRPEYRERYAIEADDLHVVQATSTFTRADRARMLRLRNVETVAERHGALRHVLRYLQWDHGLAATDVMERIADLMVDDPHRYRAVTWLFSYFDLFSTAPICWSDVYADVRRLVQDEFGIEPTSGLACVLAVQEALMPAPGRSFPASVSLAHDYVAYYRSAVRDLYGSGRAGRPDSPLAAHPPAVLEVAGDPLDLCVVGLHFLGDSRDESLEGDFHTGMVGANELRSPLTRILPTMAGHNVTFSGPEVVDELLGSVAPQTADVHDDVGAQPVALRPRTPSLS